MGVKAILPVIRDLYDADFFEWSLRNADLLRSGNFDDADVERIAEELEDIGRSQQRAVESHLCVLLTHLLKWQSQPERRQRAAGWRATIRVQRLEIADLLEQMPTLRRLLPTRLAKIYPRAVIRAAAETRLPETSFPPSCPFAIDQILDDEFFPA